MSEDIQDSLQTVLSYVIFLLQANILNVHWHKVGAILSSAKHWTSLYLNRTSSVGCTLAFSIFYAANTHQCEFYAQLRSEYHNHL